MSYEDGAMCWDHCHKCGRSQHRFWVKSKEQFEQERAENQPEVPCQFCGGKLVSYHEPDPRVFPEKDAAEVAI